MFLNKLLLVSALSLLGICEPNTPQDFDNLSRKFIAGYKVLHLADLDLSYAQNLQHIKPIANVDEQVVFFTDIRQELKTIDFHQLNVLQKQDYELMTYETGLNLERCKLERAWLSTPHHDITDSGLYKQVNGKSWYAYFLKKWVSANVTPDEIFQFGLKEVDRVKGHIEAIRRQTGMDENAFYKHLNDPSFFINDPKVVQQSFINTKAIIYANLGNLFSTQKIPPLAIEKGKAKNMAQTPGYYDSNTFYYNLFDKPYNKRQVDWLFIHEGVPGHHYQLSVSNASKSTEVQQLFFYIGFSEGWAAYTEELGKQLGVYKTPYDELGKWEWDIVRSVRVPLDVGINYYGWSDAQALTFWKKSIRNQDDIAMREISRIKRWPAQVVTYKYSALQIMQWKEELQKREGAKFDIKNFHNKILLHGSLPVFMVKANVLGRG
jgi:uncharacterized protein (DUF885 family)